MRLHSSVSVVITTRRRPHLLPRALRSALNQTHAPLEVIVVVDGADEATCTYLANLQEPNVRVIALNQPVGGSQARNCGVEAAQGDWIAFLDDDDEWRAEKLQAQLKIASRSTAQYPVVACRVLARTANGQQFIWPRRRRGLGEHLSEYLLARNSFVQGEGLITTSMILAPRALLMRTRFTPGLARHQEWDWLLRASASCEAEVIVAWDVLATWHIEENRPSISRMDQWRTSFDWILAMRRLITPRAFASFLLVFVSAIAAREGDYPALLTIVREARKHGKPIAIDYVLCFAMWILPQKARRSIRDFFSLEAQPA